jgi:hypothetical protein
MVCCVEFKGPHESSDRSLFESQEQLEEGDRTSAPEPGPRTAQGVIDRIFVTRVGGRTDIDPEVLRLSREHLTAVPLSSQAGTRLAAKLTELANRKG